jgi:hypothetical protein
VLKHFGVCAGDLVESIGKTFSIGEEKLISDLRKINSKAEEYVLKINPEVWEYIVVEE